MQHDASLRTGSEVFSTSELHMESEKHTVVWVGGERKPVVQQQELITQPTVEVQDLLTPLDVLNRLHHEMYGLRTIG